MHTSMKRFWRPTCAFACILLVSCRHEEPQIFKLEKVSKIKESHQGTKIVWYFVISNPPSNKDKLKRLVDTYIQQHLVLPKTASYHVGWIFMKETSFTPRTYVETSPKHDLIEDHLDDMILYVDWEKTVYGTYNSYRFYKNNKMFFESHSESS